MHTFIRIQSSTGPLCLVTVAKHDWTTPAYLGALPLYLTCFSDPATFKTSTRFQSALQHLKCSCAKIISADIDNDCNWRNDLHNLLRIFTYCGCERTRRLRNAITRLRRSTLPDYDIDHILKLSVSRWRRPRRNGVVSERRWNEERTRAGEGRI